MLTGAQPVNHVCGALYQFKGEAIAIFGWGTAYKAKIRNDTPIKDDRDNIWCVEMVEDRIWWDSYFFYTRAINDGKLNEIDGKLVTNISKFAHVYGH